MSARIEIPKMYKLFIGGKFTRTESERYIEVINPKTKDKTCNISRASRKDVRNAVVSARSGFESWSSKSGYERGQILYRFAEILEGRKEQFIEEIYSSTLQKKSACESEVSKAIDRIIYFAGFADKWMQLISSVNPVQEGYFNFSVPEPVGVVGVILPDNLSFLPLVSRILAVTTTGNSCVIIANEKSPLPSHLAGHYDINSIDYCEETGNNRKLVKELCANNVKRFNETGDNKNWDWFSDKLNENFKEIGKFTELKTVWQSA